MYSWFLIVAMTNSDDLLIKEMSSKSECIKEQKSIQKQMRMEKIKFIEDVSCKMGSIDNDENKPREEFL